MRIMKKTSFKTEEAVLNWSNRNQDKDIISITWNTEQGRYVIFYKTYNEEV